MNTSYQIDRFDKEHLKNEMKRLSENVDSHSHTLSQLFLENGLYGAKHILDVGYGTGAMINLFSGLLPEASFTGIDNSEKILDTVKGTDKIQFFHGHADSLPFADESFDFVYTRLVLMHNPNPAAIIEEMTRVCKPGGVVCAVEIDDGTQVFHPFGFELSKFVNALIEFAKTNGTDRTMGRKLYSHFISAGLSDVKVITQTSDYAMQERKADMPILIRFALGNDQGKRFVDAGLLQEEERLELINHILPAYCSDPHRYESSSFMYAFGKKY